MRGSYRLSGDCLTKAVLSCQGPPDTSQSRLFPLVLHHAGELVQSSVISRARAIKKGFIGSFMLETALENTLALFSKTHKTTYKTLS